MNPKFDRLFISLPSEFVTIYDRSQFTVTLSGEGEPLRYKYEQTTPFYYLIIVDEKKHETKLEFSGKALLEHYPSLIDESNISECIKNINAKHICYISWTPIAYQSAQVLQCDVTADIHSSYRIPEIYAGMMKQSSRDWQIESYTSTRFAIENTAVTRRYRIRMSIYDKEIEMGRSTNVAFLDTVRNKEYQLEYFKNKIRIELNLNSVNRIRRYLKVEKSSLSAVLSSREDPIGRFLSESVVCSDPIRNAICISENMKMLEHLLLLALCNFDIEKIECIVRELYSERSARRVIKTYKEIIIATQHNVSDIDTNLVFADIRNHLRYMLTVCLPNSIEDPRNLHSLYHSKNCETWGDSHQTTNEYSTHDKQV